MQKNQTLTKSKTVILPEKTNQNNYHVKEPKAEPSKVKKQIQKKLGQKQLKENTKPQKVIQKRSKSVLNSEYRREKKQKFQKKKQNYSINIKQEYLQFLKQMFLGLRIINENHYKLQFSQLLNYAYQNFKLKKEKGEWKQITDQVLKITQDFQQNNAINKSCYQKQKQINQLSHKLKNYLNKLSQGYRFIKYSFRKTKCQKCSLFLSYDFKFLAWGPIDQNQQIKSVSLMNMNEYIGISPGTKSETFRKYKDVNQELAFSLCFTSRTIDLVAQNKKEKKEFIQGIRFIHQCLN